MEDTYIQFGCGLCAPPGWRNFDAGPIFWIQKHTSLLNPLFRRKKLPIYPIKAIEYADVVAGLPVREQAASGIYCSHILEHLALDEFRATIKNVFRYLRPGGVFRLVVPDLEFMIKRYVANDGPDASVRLMEETILGVKQAHRGIRSAPQMLFGRSRHLWMWDYKGMAQELKNVGFVNIRRAQFNDSADPRFREVEDADRWKDCLGVECVHP